MALYIPHSILHLARLLYVRPETFGPYYVDVSQIEPDTYKFLHLIASSRLEIIFEGRPRGFKTPNYKEYKCEYSERLVVLIEVEVRHVKRCFPYL